MKNRSIYGINKLITVLCLMALACIILVINSCQKSTQHTKTGINSNPQEIDKMALVQNQPQTDIVSVLGIQKSTDCKTAYIRFSRHELLFMVTDASILAKLEVAFNTHTPINIVYDPWQASVLQVNAVTENELSNYKLRTVIKSINTPINIGALGENQEIIDHIAEMGVINTTTPGLTPAIPDMATAQLIFNYFSSQCCINPSPYSIDHCITFQYCADGCYARAHKMCYLLNNKYHYATQKVFSFATGSYSLSVKAEKWCGRCINWWYHVAPLVTIVTPTGPKAFVFDPSMFDEPVPLNTWLHAQKNPACSGNPGVTSINIQPTAAYSPAASGDTSTFDTDPLYSNTNSTLIGYRYLHTCP